MSTEFVPVCKICVDPVGAVIVLSFTAIASTMISPAAEVTVNEELEVEPELVAIGPKTSFGSTFWKTVTPTTHSRFSPTDQFTVTVPAVVEGDNKYHISSLRLLASTVSPSLVNGTPPNVTEVTSLVAVLSDPMETNISLSDPDGVKLAEEVRVPVEEPLGSAVLKNPLPPLAALCTVTVLLNNATEVCAVAAVGTVLLSALPDFKYNLLLTVVWL